MAVWLVAPLSADPSRLCPPPACGNENESSEPASSGDWADCGLVALACISNSVCRVCAPNCGDELPDAPLVEDEDAPPDDAVAPVVVFWPWPSAANNDA